MANDGVCVGKENFYSLEDALSNDFIEKVENVDAITFRELLADSRNGSK